MGYNVGFSGEEDTMGELDDGARCDEHVGEVFPPRCARCDALRNESSSDGCEPGTLSDLEPYPLAS